MKDQLENILQKRMDRKDFLKHVGIGMAALVGFTSLVKALNPDSKNANAYGASAYGGASKTK